MEILLFLWFDIVIECKKLRVVWVLCEGEESKIRKIRGEYYRGEGRDFFKG